MLRPLSCSVPAVEAASSQLVPDALHLTPLCRSRRFQRLEPAAPCWSALSWPSPLMLGLGEAPWRCGRRRFASLLEDTPQPRVAKARAKDGSADGRRARGGAA